ncbi:MAG: isoaspartyl peptidase/L-asparaginase [Ignavibacteria bacterium]|nr:isoaspartyl peptidase/L-asparaginase [Ignavibacteria bacterium]
MPQKLATVILLLCWFAVSMPAQVNYCLVIHGGAGTCTGMTDSMRAAYTRALNEVLQAGNNLLKNGGSALDAVEQAVCMLEDNPLFNAGKGSVLNAEGHVEMDAAIMSGTDLGCGAVASVHSVKNPVSLARKVMLQTRHVLLVGEGAEKFARECGMPTADSSYFTTPKQLEVFKKLKSRKGTVGAVALDRQGNLAAATSTGGLAGKMPGRVGDTPLIGAGTYANNSTCAISCTGTGELFIRNSVAFRVSALMEYKKLSLHDAVSQVVYSVLQPGDGGCIAVDKAGNYSMECNTQCMFRGVVNSEGVFMTAIDRTAMKTQ